MSLTPEKLGPYTLERPLARGGMGEVYLATDTRLGRSVAVKVLPSGADAAALGRFLREARATAALQHSNIAMLHDVGEDSGSSYIVMERIEGRTLAEMLAGGGAVPWKGVTRYGRQLASALAHAHAHGILHRDIKPGNIVVSPGRGAVLLDFGLAAGLPGIAPAVPLEAPDSSGEALTREGRVMGTAPYMSPEQLQGLPLDHRSDLFQLGVTLYEALSGSHPFRGATSVDTTYATLRAEARPLSEVAPVPRRLGDLVGQLLEKDPARRPASAARVAAELEELETGSQPAVGPDEPTEVERPVVRLASPLRAPWWIAAVAVVVAGAIAWGVDRTRRTGPAGPPARLVPFTAGGADAQHPAFSPDGASVAFASNRGGRWDLWIGLVAGGEPVRITDTPEVESRPAWAPDGARLAFLRGPLQGVAAGADVLVMPALGGPTRRIVGQALDPAWSPDGDWIAYADVSEGWSRIVRVPVDGSGEPTPVTGLEPGFFHRNPAWSPGGEAIAFNRSPGGLAGQIMLAPVDGRGAPRALTSDPDGTANLAPVFTPDGSAVIYSSDRGGSMNLWRVGLSGEPPERLTSGPGQDLNPTLSPDARRLAYVVSPVATRVFDLDPSTGESESLATLDGADAWAPALDPASGRVALSRKVPGQPWDLVLVDPASGAPRPLLHGQPDTFWPRFLPDGSGILFFVRRETGGRVGRVSPDGTGLTWLTAEEESATYPDVSPDGRWLTFVRPSVAGERVVVRPVDGGRDDESVVAEGATLPRFSPDGTRLCFARSRSWAGGVGVAEVEAGDGDGVRWLTETGTWPTWMPDGREVAFADAGEEGQQTAWRVPAAGGERSPLGEYRWRGSHWPFAVSPNGRLVSTDAAGGSATIWLAEFSP